jgi:hypothetical protein
MGAKALQSSAAKYNPDLEYSSGRASVHALFG